MRRKLFTFTATLSLLLCVAACVLWVRSYRVVDIYQNHRAGRYRQIVSSWGLLYLELGPTSLPDASTWTSRTGPYVSTGPVPKLDWRFHEFMSLTGTTKGVPQRFSQLIAPHWSFRAAVRNAAGGLGGATVCGGVGASRRVVAQRAASIFAPRRRRAEPSWTAARNAARFQRAHRKPPHNPPIQRTATASTGAVQ
jgi:hypothetical protein